MFGRTANAAANLAGESYNKFYKPKIQQAIVMLKKEANELDSIISELERNWKGNGAETYISELKKLKAKVSTTVKDLSVVYDTINRKL